ncbi:hypothetical protein SPHINGO391_510215 [Sphingomonas aurantiaca]|uniref:Uncharacterized protein n=1 Tax=Sphingomonas aurantiaca TaxID=185949 RepID=A0A5E8AM92_9SPHN|nr:hypothetical protein SPHINGO391_510215 [Sphingomonas aurantiaca]
MPPPDGLSFASNIEIWVEKPVVAPQSRWNSTATRVPSGEGLRETTVFWQAFEHPEQIIIAANDAALIVADGNRSCSAVNRRFRERKIRA